MRGGCDDGGLARGLQSQSSIKLGKIRRGEKEGRRASGQGFGASATSVESGDPVKTPRFHSDF